MYALLVLSEKGIPLVLWCLQGAVNEELGLQEMTSDISKLVNLTTLIVGCSKSLECIPESLSCLQKLEAVNIRISQITDVPPGLARLANLSSLAFTDCGPLRFPPSLQVSDSDCC